MVVFLWHLGAEYLQEVNKSDIGTKLKVLLKDNGMTQEDLAERLEVSRQAVGKWVNDKGIPEVGKLVQISDLFGVSTDYLLKEDCEEKPYQQKKLCRTAGIMSVRKCWTDICRTAGRM